VSVDFRRHIQNGGDMRFTLMMFTASLMAPALSTAQVAAPTPDWPLTPGLRVRILSPVLGDRPQTGNVVSATSDTLVFLPAKQSASTAVSTPNIARVDVARGTHAHKLQGALLGLLAGAGAGLIIGSATYKPPKCNPDVWCMDMFGEAGNTVAGAVLGGLLGTITGLFIGSRETDNWVQVTVPSAGAVVR
jgi:hypothetical protein